MRHRSDMNVVRGWRQPSALAWVLMAGTLVMAGLVARSSEHLADLSVEVENIEHRIAQRKRTNEANQLRQKRLSPEDRRIERALVSQEMSVCGSGMPVIDWIEHAWTPDIAIKQLIVEKAGRHVRMEGGAAALRHIYGFVERLHGYQPHRKVALLQHQVAQEGGRPIIRFTLSIEQQ